MFVVGTTAVGLACVRRHTYQWCCCSLSVPPPSPANVQATVRLNNVPLYDFDEVAFVNSAADVLKVLSFACPT